MKAPGFLAGVGVALAGALAASVVVFLLAGVVAMPLLLRLLIAAIGLGYGLWLLARSGVRAGRVSAVVVWTLFTAVTLVLDPPLLLHLCTQVGLIWLLRAFCVHRSVLPALADLGLSAASVAASLPDVPRIPDRDLGRRTHRQRVPRRVVPAAGAGGAHGHSPSRAPQRGPRAARRRRSLRPRPAQRGVGGASPVHRALNPCSRSRRPKS